MTQYAKPADGDSLLTYPTPQEFPGVPNWQQHSTLLRKHGYMPLSFEGIDIPEGVDVSQLIPTAITIVPRSAQKDTMIEVEVDDYEEDPETHEQRKSGSHREWQPATVTVDASYIQVTDYVMPSPPPPPSHSVQDYNNELESYLHEVRARRGYTERDPAEYYNSTVPRWAQDARDWIAFRDRVMLYGLQTLNQYTETGAPPMSLEEFRTGLEQIVIEWHDGE